MIFHVIPANDTLAHEEKSTCHCDPRLEMVNSNIIIVHNSYDGREGVEIVNEILNGDIEEKQNIERLIKKKKAQPIVVKDSDLVDRNTSISEMLNKDIEKAENITNTEAKVDALANIVHKKRDSDTREHF